MSPLLEKAVQQARRLRDDQQDAIGAFLIAEIADETCWDEAFERSHDVLERMAMQAEQEDRLGKTQPLDPDSL